MPNEPKEPAEPPKPVHDPVSPPLKDPPDKPMRDPPGDPTYEPDQPFGDPEPTPGQNDPRPPNPTALGRTDEMLRKGLVALTAAALIVTAFSTLPADARAKKEKRYRVQQPVSLDGRNLGYPRTCGYTFFQYDALGVPSGPYCH